MRNIRVIMKDGTQRNFPYKGDHIDKIRYEEKMLHIRTACCEEITIPLHEVKEVQITS